LDDAIEIVSRMPWWAGVLLAAVTWYIFHRMAQVAPGTVTSPGQMGAFVQRSMLAAFGYALQFVAPIGCLIGAAASAIGRARRKKLVKGVQESPAAESLNNLSWREFEMLVAEGFRRQGFTVQEIGGNGPDGGVDLVLKRGGETSLVQCKQWKALNVGVDVVRELYGVMAARGAAHGFVVTSGAFTTAAKEFAVGRNLKLVDGPQLHRLIRAAKEVRAASGVPPAVAGKAPAGRDEAPECPVCSAVMVRRVAKKGANAGSAFWGCSKFSSCRGTI